MYTDGLAHRTENFQITSTPFRAIKLTGIIEFGDLHFTEMGVHTQWDMYRVHVHVRITICMSVCSLALNSLSQRYSYMHVYCNQVIVYAQLFGFSE